MSLGTGNVLHAHVSLVGNTTIGPSNEFFQYACIGSRTEDMKFKAGSIARVEIGAGNIFREYCTVNAATEDGAITKIGDGSVFLSDSHVGHDVDGCGLPSRHFSFRTKGPLAFEDQRAHSLRRIPVLTTRQSPRD